MSPMEYVTDEEEAIVWTSGLLFGPPKTGKTAGAFTAPGDRVLYVSFETSRNATVFARRRRREMGLPKLREVKVPRYQKEATPIWDMMVEIGQGVWAEKPLWDVVIIDPIGEFYRRLLEEQTDRSRHPSLEQRGTAWADLERWIRSMVEAPCHFIVVAHEMETTNDDGKSIMPFVGSQSASEKGFGPKLAGLVDWIAYTGVIEVEGEKDQQYVAQLRPGNGRKTGSRFPELMTEKIRPVNLTEWFQIAGVYIPGAQKAEEVEEHDFKFRAVV